METKRIVMTSTFYPPYHLGGDAIHVKYLAEELVRKGHEVHVVHSLDAFDLKARRKRPRAERTGVFLHPVETTMGSASAAMSYLTGINRAAERALRKVISETRPDWVHHHNISLLGYGVLSVGKSRRIYTAHDHWLVCPRNDLMYLGKEKCIGRDCTTCSLLSGRPPQLWRNGGLKDSVGSIDRTISPSEYMAGVLNDGLGLKSQVLPNFVPRPAALEDGNSEPHFAYVGVLEPHKGIDLLLKGYEAGEVRSELHIIGKGSMEPLVKEYERRTEGKVRYLGFMDRGRLLPEMASAISLVTPSVCQENSPLSCIEALSVGTPLLVTPNGGLPELITGPCGLVAEPTAESVGSAMKLFEEQEGMRESMSANAAKRYEEVHTPEGYLRSYLALAEGIA
jgi:glycosyltransferase involved in cell wall biosynthesis